MISTQATLAYPHSLSTLIRTLVMSGFILETAQRNPGFILVFMNRFDEFNLKHSYCFLFPDKDIDEIQCQLAQTSANYKKAQLIVVGGLLEEYVCIEWKRFFNLFGGPVLSTAPFDPDFSNQIITLGFNKLPYGLTGKPDELFEVYVRVALEFILSGRVIGYGKERKFEVRPDGIAIPDRNFTALYDAKAYSDGYKVTRDSIRQFKDYIIEFHSLYESYLPRIKSFIVISGSFIQKQPALEQRSRDLIADCGVPIAFLDVTNLSEIIQLIIEYPKTRRSINWSRIFTEPIVTSKAVKAEIDRMMIDKIIPS